MPPIIEDYAAIKRRMDELEALVERGDAFVIRESDGVYRLVDARGVVIPVFDQRTFSILTPEGRALIDKNKDS